MQEEQKVLSANVVIQVNQKNMSCSGSGQDEILNFQFQNGFP